METVYTVQCQQREKRDTSTSTPKRFLTDSPQITPPVTANTKLEPPNHPRSRSPSPSRPQILGSYSDTSLLHLRAPTPRRPLMSFQHPSLQQLAGPVRTASPLLAPVPQLREVSPNRLTGALAGLINTTEGGTNKAM